MFKPLRLMGEVMALAYLVNETTDYCVFTHFAGHVDTLEVEVAKSKDDFKTKIFKSEFYIDGKHNENDPEEMLINLKATLEGYLLPNLELQLESTRP